VACATKTEHEQRIEQISQLIIREVQEDRYADGHGLQQRDTRLAPLRSRARDCNSFVVATVSATSAAVTDSTTEITPEVRHDGPRE
jgi:hypothetical protein